MTRPEWQVERDALDRARARLSDMAHRDPSFTLLDAIRELGEMAIETKPERGQS